MRSILLAAVVIAGSVSGCGAKQTQLLEAAEVAETETGQGVTATEIRVGFIFVDQTKLNSVLGLTSAPTGDIEAQLKALAADVNSRGGIGGRNLVPVLRIYDALVDSAASEEKLCRQFAEDDKVFAVVLLGQFQPTARPCYAALNTVMIDQTLYPVEQQEAEKLAPYFVQPNLPEYGSLLSGLASALSETRFFTAATRLGILGIDTEQNRRAYEEQLLPKLEALQADPVDVQWIDPATNASLQAGQNQAVLSLKSKKVDRVIVIGGSRLLAFFATIAIPQKFFPRYAVTSFDNPEYISNQAPEVLRGAIGVSVAPSVDLKADALEFPFNAGEAKCLKAVEPAGFKFESRANARVIVTYCDAVTLLERAFKGFDGEPLTAELFTQQLATIGPFDSAVNYAAAFEPNSYGGADAYRPIKFDETCSCFTLIGPTKDFER